MALYIRQKNVWLCANQAYMIKGQEISALSPVT